MSADLDARGLSREELSRTYIRFSRVWRVLGLRKNTAYQWVAEGRFPLEVIREGNILYCYSSELDAHIRGDHLYCWHSQPREERIRADRGDEQLARNLAIARAYNNGSTESDLARRFGLTRQRVHQIVLRWTLPRGVDEGNDQGDGEDE